MKKYPAPIAKFLSSKATKLSPLISQAKRITQINIILNQSLDYEIAKHVQVSNIHNNQLRLIVDSAAWATRLRYKQSEIINRFKNFAITKSINAIHIKISPSNNPVSEKPKRHNNIKLSKSSAELMAREIEVIDDENLKNALIRITRHAK